MLNRTTLIISFLFATATAVYLNLPAPPPKTQGCDGEDPLVTKPFVAWEREPDCVGRALCEADANDAYLLGKRLVEDSRADITNPYAAYVQFDLALRYVEHGKLAHEPEWFDDANTARADLKQQLDATFQQARVRFHIATDHKDFAGATHQLDYIRALFPDRRCLYYMWAVEQQQQMMARGTYSRRPIS